MIRKWIVTGAGLLWIALAMGTGAAKLRGPLPQAPAPDQAKPAYTMAEYNQYQAADQGNESSAKSQSSSMIS